MSNRALISLEQCLFTAFANSDLDNPQEPRQMWAIQEGVRRAYPGNYSVWRSTHARKDHECVRGCEIKQGDIYFKMALGGGWGNDLNACAGCMAMILYFQGAHEMEPEFYTHWDLRAGAPVRIINEQGKIDDR